MCGITSIFSYHPVASSGICRNELTQINESMVTRGPDGSGYWYSDCNRVGLAHRRLSILDLSDDGKQPMRSSNGRYIISFNGEIYNYRELRLQLENKGYIFRTESDTEVILSLYAEKGMDMLNDLRGMFAFSLWDNLNRKMYIARDPLGIKPLYYSNDGWVIRVASQVKALIAGGKISTIRSPASVVGFFLFGHIPEPFTMYQDVQELQAGHYAVIDSNGMQKPVQYFSVQEDVSSMSLLSRDQAEEYLYNALTESVNYHTVSDVPVGVFLSAGIDSGGILSLANGQKADAMETVTLSFDEFRGTAQDESQIASDVAEHYGNNAHSNKCLRYQEFRDDLDLFFDAMDQPTTDALNTYFVSKAASELGWKVALSGVGGDEMFRGYPSFQDIPRWRSSLLMFSMFPMLGSIFQHSFMKLQMSNRLNLNPKMAGMIKYSKSYAGAYLLKRGLFLPEELPELLGKDLSEEGLRQLNPIDHISDQMESFPGANTRKVSALESSLYMRNQLLRDADWAGMAHSLEIRTPLVDAHLLRKIAPILSSKWNEKSKGLFVSTLKKPLPNLVTDRKKSGFYTPVSSWLQTDERLDSWRSVSSLGRQDVPWARRWAYVVAKRTALI